jgi:hypothetical protein
VPPAVAKVIMDIDGIQRLKDLSASDED